MTRYLAPALALSMIAAATVAAAQGAPTAVTRAQLTANTDQQFATINTSKSGKISKAEVETAMNAQIALQIKEINLQRDAAFDKADSDHNGQISKAEYAAANPIGTPPRADGSKFMAQFDGNKDGIVTQAEFRAPRLALFDKLDTNKDGTVSLAEQQAGAKASR